ncbi:MAG: hypothetical protein A2147_04470 [Chloroflexi bacterium RBG_16_57_8]|nr:MAG: hypothetical protein A2147_04470 [Chloroflexi bacterium RBG_16_57_8]
MTDSEDRINDIFEDMVEMGLLSTSNQWLEKAIEQKDPRLTVDLACSSLLVYDTADKMLLSITDLN